MIRRTERPGDPAAGGRTPSPVTADGPVAVIDIGASSVRLVIAEIAPGEPVRILEEASRGVMLGKDTFTRGRLTAPTMEAALIVLEGFRRIMDGYGPLRYRAVATSAVREAANRDGFLDRVRLRTGITVDIIEVSEENRLTYLAIREVLRENDALTSEDTLLIEVGGGSADISLLRRGEPVFSSAYPLGAIRLQQNLAGWQGTHDQKVRLLRRHVLNVVEDIRREIPLDKARHFIALGGDVRFAASRILGDGTEDGDVRVVDRDAFLEFCRDAMKDDPERLVGKYRMTQTDAETLVPALLVTAEILEQTPSPSITIPEASLRAGLLLDFSRTGAGSDFEEFRRQVLSSATALGEKYRYDAAHARKVADLAMRLFDELEGEHGLSRHDRLLLEVAALLHDIGIYISLRAHHKHTQYILSVSEIFGFSRDDISVVATVARYHRRAMPQRSHAAYTALDRDRRVIVNKLAALLRLANALDSDHLQKVRDLRIVREGERWILEVEGAGDLTMERLASLSRSDLFFDTFGKRLTFRETAGST